MVIEALGNLLDIDIVELPKLCRRLIIFEGRSAMRVFVHIEPQRSVERGAEIQLRRLGGSNDVDEILDVPLLPSSFQRHQISLLGYTADHEAIWVHALDQLHTTFVDLVILEEFATFSQTARLRLEPKLSPTDRAWTSRCIIVHHDGRV